MAEVCAIAFGRSILPSPAALSACHSPELWVWSLAPVRYVNCSLVQCAFMASLCWRFVPTAGNLRCHLGSRCRRQNTMQKACWGNHCLLLQDVDSERSGSSVRRSCRSLSLCSYSSKHGNKKHSILTLVLWNSKACAARLRLHTAYTSIHAFKR